MQGQPQIPPQVAPLAAAPSPRPEQNRWYVQVDGQAYGPFDDATLWKFMIEARVTETSVVSNHPNTGYRTVASDPNLMSWMAQRPAQDPEPEPTPVADPTVFMIMGEIRSGRGMEFLQRLQGLGQVQRIGDTVWLLQARARAETVRDVLAQPLGAEDRVFVLDSYANETAWFNLSADMDAQVQALWDLNRVT